MAGHHLHPHQDILDAYSKPILEGKSHKSLDCYINFASGWVGKVLVDDKRADIVGISIYIAYQIYSTTHIFFQQVTHTQRLSQ